jgi:hypothetical protein
MKRLVDVAVLRGNTSVQCAKDFYDYLQKHCRETKDKSLCAKRHFRYIETVERNRDRLFKSIQNNRTIHQIRSTTSHQGILNVKKLSCYTCDQCLEGKYTMCDSEQTGGNTVIKVEKEGESVASDDDEGDVYREVALHEVVRRGTLVAIYTDDETDDYYLARATKQAEILTQSETDDWGNSFPKDSVIIRSLYYSKTSDLSYNLIQKKRALLHINSLLYVVTEIKADQHITLPVDVHEQILGVVSESGS